MKPREQKTTIPDRCEDPFFGDVPTSLNLSNAPLVRVLGQIRFSKIAKIAEESYIADFQEAIRKEYPHFQKDVIEGVQLKLGRQTVQHQSTSAVIWRFSDPTKMFRVSLSSEAIALETTRYESRSDFLSRFGFILDSLKKTMQPSLLQRVGFRYIGRLQGEEVLHSLGDLVYPEIRNVWQPNLTPRINAAMTDLTGETKEGKLIVRYGLAPPHYSHDADTVPPIGERSWVMDVDSFSTNCAGQEFASSMLCDELDKVAARGYAFFRWSVTDKFLERFGVNQ